ncbi:hypothetical protein B0J11DRAFT_549549 [Dendryphion nanum]|uniref:Uncharacterized protein n=1 Tax=Dendryphion nanum TaxID=256645 RepID=A0A9P9INC3_9PLEO|nr:hypothetical protein B0J11DRAFT_549549 [Dendryphion nanum]
MTSQDSPYGENFALATCSWKQDRLTVRELSMLQLINSITDKPNWWKKVFDEEIIAKWHQEASALALFSENLWTWCVAEIRDKAVEFERTGVVAAIDTGSRPIKSDTLAVQPLQNLPDDKKDWHPKSNDQVLNLVHPSLFPLIYGKTRVLSQGGQVGVENFLDSYGKGDILPQQELQVRGDPEDIQQAKWSTKFQWLPCEVEFTGEGNSVKITSYINNLHPLHHQDLYRVIEKLISISIEPWNQAILIHEDGGRVPPRIRTYGSEWDPSLPEWAEENDYPKWNLNRANLGDKEYEDLLAKVKEYLKLPDNPEFNKQEYDEESTEINRESVMNGEWEEECEDLAEIIDWKWNHIRKTVHPDFGTLETYQKWKLGFAPNPLFSSEPEPRENSVPYLEPYHIDLAKTWRDQGLQVIVKIASIELTPEKPEYEGGSWHLEGMLNEHIVSTSIYYYDVENTTESRIRFRLEATLNEESLQYEQSVHQPLCEIFGTESMSEEPAVQEIGSVSTPQGRLLAFPNTLQHCVSPFRLEDASKPGHRRFIVLWLVDPTFRIVSTRNVPPQRHDWWAPEAYSNINHPLPAELAEMVQQEVGEWPMGMNEAKELRLELMEERTNLMPAIQNSLETYNLCEH